jgi:glycosyltransferase involved in cell wall biosynthesis
MKIKASIKSKILQLFPLAKDWKLRLTASAYPEKSIVFYTGITAEQWTPESLKTGLGGSQTAVVYLCKEWAKAGYKVTVYNFCGNKEGIYDGVEYLQFSRFNPYDTFDNLILWRGRSLPLLDYPLKAKKIFLEMQDVPKQLERFHKKRIDKVDKIVVKCQFHRHCLPHIPDEKFAIFSNGIDASIPDLTQVEKEPYKLIYASNYIRGLEQMLIYGWPIIKEAIPQAHLHIYYGWNFFDKSSKKAPERLDWKQKMLELINQPGVTDHGRIGQEKLIAEKATAAIHYYGCTYPETDCISVRESAMVGCVPVTTDLAALSEKPYCLKIPGDPAARETQEAIARKIVELLKAPEQLSQIRQEFQKAVKPETWDNIAQRWRQEFSRK